eukprot:9969626-Alexandrium_andersonii.AAC.1
MERLAFIRRLATRIQALPGAVSFRELVAAIMFAPKLSWGALAGGHPPSVAQQGVYSSIYRTAVRGAAQPRHCPFLWQAL